MKWLLLFLLFPACEKDANSTSPAELLGCTDQAAINYDPQATVDDSSCVYSFTEPYYQVDIEPTGILHQVIIQSSVSPLLPADDIGLFDHQGLTSNGSCDSVYANLLVGAGRWLGTQLEIVGRGSSDDCAVGGFQKSGFTNGNPLFLHIYRHGEDREYIAQNLMISNGAGIFGQSPTIMSDFEIVPLVWGCTLETALNYDPGATADDHTCLEQYSVEIQPTGYNHLVVFLTSITSLEAGDEIGLFDLAGLISEGTCAGLTGELLVGAGSWTGEQLEISAIGSLDNCELGGTQHPGFGDGHDILIRIYRPETGEIFDADPVYQAGVGLFGVDLFTVVEDLSLISISRRNE